MKPHFALFVIAGLCAGAAAAAGVGAGAGALAQDEGVYKDRGRRDPFVALVSADGRLLSVEQPETKKEELTIQGVVIDPGKESFLLANGRIVPVGGIIEGYTVEKIGNNVVTLSKDGESREVVINREENP